MGSNIKCRARKNKPAQKTMLLVVEGTTEKIYFERLKGLERYSSLKIRQRRAEIRSL